jgi:hypothetical protein
MGECGVVRTATPHILDAGILLKGRFCVSEMIAKDLLDSEGGEAIALESRALYFSLKLDWSGQPFELRPIKMTDGRVLIFKLNAYEVSLDGKKIVKK